MNSLLYLAETKITEDFYSMLLFELFTFFGYNTIEFSNFFEFIKKRIDSLITKNDINSKELEKDSKIIDNHEEMKIMSTSIERIKTIFAKLNHNSRLQLGIKLVNNKIKKELKKLYLIHSSKHYYFIHSEYFYNLQDIINNINNN